VVWVIGWPTQWLQITESVVAVDVELPVNMVGLYVSASGMLAQPPTIWGTISILPAFGSNSVIWSP
jgi:hypothetical protein